MARYTGPACRICRSQGDKLMLKGDKCFTPKCPVEKRHTPPGQHTSSRRKKVSEYSLQLKEKQRARYIYGVLERQFRKHFAEAERLPGLSGENLLQLLEMRLDNVAYRLGFADSRRQARQLVLHGHISVRGRVTDIPSYQVKVGNVISWKEGSTKLVLYQVVVKNIESKTIPSWLSLDRDTMSGRVLAKPSRSDIEATIDERLIVAFYSR
ncbi:MAG: 30S ribosomal protein S4 [Chloroflexi bacterium]|jgi:small subunit ribosomal protein S4|nr:30S ribosomal protein S4 [Chloroflexota bacterium]